jgi:FKBP-type peptidyl-prolyl cis-trans isomerase SlyD
MRRPALALFLFLVSCLLCCSPRVSENKVVRLKYKITLSDGSIYDSSDESGFLDIVVGAGQTLPALEEGIMGMRVGEKKTIEIKAADSPFGEYDQSRIGDVPRSELPPDLDMEVGTTVLAQSPSGAQSLATIKAVKGDTVTVDLNHPMAGKDMRFEAEVVTMWDATKEDLTPSVAPPAVSQ